MSNQLGQIYGSVKNAETYIILNSENVELSGNVYINGSINQNVDISGNLNISGGLAIDNSFGISGEVLTSQGSTSSPIWSVPTASTSALNSASFTLTNTTPAGSASFPLNTISTVNGAFTTIVSSSIITNNNNGTFTVNTAGTYLINMTIDIVRRPNLYNILQIYISRNRNNTITQLCQSVKKDTPADDTEFTLNLSHIDTFLINDDIVMQGYCNQNWEVFGFNSNPSGISKTFINIIRLS